MNDYFISGSHEMLEEEKKGMKITNKYVSTSTQ